MVHSEGHLDKYRLDLRRDLPSGFVENPRIPELPIVYQHLHYASVRTVEPMNSWKQYFTTDFQRRLEESGAPVVDRKIREGIQLDPDSLHVFVYNDGMSAVCYFGTLVKVGEL